jgi:hypothetical protein
MRLTVLPTLAVLAALAGCATPLSGPRGESEYDRIARECAERGGILKPIGGAPSPNDAANYACEIGGAGPTK